MVSSIGYALGIGSGIDTAKLVEDLYMASRAPKEAAIKKREEVNAAKVSALGQASSAISSFSTALSALIAGGSLYTQPTVSDTSILTAKAVAGSQLGNFSGHLEVKQLAQAQTATSLALASASDPIGRGECRIQRPPKLPRLEGRAAVVRRTLLERVQPRAYFRNPADDDHGHGGVGGLHLLQLILGRKDELNRVILRQRAGDVDGLSQLIQDGG